MTLCPIGEAPKQLYIRSPSLNSFSLAAENSIARLFYTAIN